MEQEKDIVESRFIYIEKSWPRYIFEVFTDEMNGQLGVMSADELMAVIESIEAPLNLYRPLKKGTYRKDLNWENLRADFPYLSHDISLRLYWLPPKRDTTFGQNPILFKRLVSDEQIKRSNRRYPKGVSQGIPAPNTRHSVKTGEVLTDIAFHLHIQTGYTMDEWFVMLGQYVDPITEKMPFINWLEDDEFPGETYFRKFKSELYGRKNGRRIRRKLSELSAIDSELAFNYRTNVSCAEILTDYVLGDKKGANLPSMFVTR